MAGPTRSDEKPRRRGVRRVIVVLLLVAGASVWATNQILTERFTETTRNRAEVRTTLYQGHLIAELKAAGVVPELLSRDPALIGALNADDHMKSTQRLLSFVDEIGAASLKLLDQEGRVVAATDRERLGASQSQDLHFAYARQSEGTVFTIREDETGAYQFMYSQEVLDGGRSLGVVVVEADLAQLERQWAGLADAVIVTDGSGRILLSTEPLWRGLDEADALARQSAPSAINRAIRATADWAALPVDAYLRGEAVMRTEVPADFADWDVVTFTTYSNVRDRVNPVLALMIMAFAILLVAILVLANRRTTSRLVSSQRKSREFKELSEKLQQEIAERKKVENTLEVAEQTIAQSSKLAALGEMSAAVSHELNQPLAAMKTYLAGARLLLTRKRTEEAVVSFQRIDDLIERMGAITKQLKSYARKGKESYEPVDVNASVQSALALMEPQFKARDVRIVPTMPDRPAMILGDRLRLEQVIINLMRNALDATQTSPRPKIEILLAAGETVMLSVRDNGPGIEDINSLFEPFYTTKEPGDGVGLGLAISSGIVTDFGGRMQARNAAAGGAVFEISLPILTPENIASGTAPMGLAEAAEEFDGAKGPSAPARTGKPGVGTTTAAE